MTVWATTSRSARSSSGVRVSRRSGSSTVGRLSFTLFSSAPNGYRRMWNALRRTGEQVRRCRVQRLMKATGSLARSGAGSRGGRPTRSIDYTQRLTDHHVLAPVGPVGDAHPPLECEHRSGSPSQARSVRDVREGGSV